MESDDVAVAEVPAHIMRVAGILIGEAPGEGNTLLPDAGREAGVNIGDGSMIDRLPGSEGIDAARIDADLIVGWIADHESAIGDRGDCESEAVGLALVGIGGHGRGILDG